MIGISATATLALVAFLIAFSATVLLNLLSGNIKTAGMLSVKKPGEIEIERVVMMITTVMGAFAYLSYGLSIGAKDGSLPDIPEELVTALGGGNLLYISGKIFRTGG